MTIKQFIKKHKPCEGAVKWGLSTGCKTMREIWERDDLCPDWRIWVATRPGVISDKDLRLFACWCVRQVWHLLTDYRSKNAVEVAEKYAVGEATNKELAAAWDSAGAAAWVAAGAAAGAADRVASGAADRAAARAAAWAEQSKKLMEYQVNL